MEQEIILIVAPAASGKSSLTNKLICLYQHQDRLHSYNRCCHRINQDHLKSLEKCLRLGRLILSSNESMPTDAYCSQIARNKKSCTTNNTAICETATDNHTTNGQVTGVFVNSIIVDNTNLSHTVRKAWVDLAKEFNIQVQCAFINPLMSFVSKFSITHVVHVAMISLSLLLDSMHLY
jgi:energy-coupling factor transporter ATP-binding protein EcfA2